VPLYDFRCRRCGESFDELVAADTLPACPHCGDPEPERLLGSFAGPFTIRPRGGDARRVNAQRQAREERRQEGFARQREERKQRGD
jgi:putative FmdB family regulatory protein